MLALVYLRQTFLSLRFQYYQNEHGSGCNVRFNVGSGQFLPTPTPLSFIALTWDDPLTPVEFCDKPDLNADYPIYFSVKY